MRTYPAGTFRVLLCHIHSWAKTKFSTSCGIVQAPGLLTDIERIPSEATKNEVGTRQHWAAVTMIKLAERNSGVAGL